MINSIHLWNLIDLFFKINFIRAKIDFKTEKLQIHATFSLTSHVNILFPIKYKVSKFMFDKL